MRVAIVSTYPPRVCGIGSFAHDLRAELVAVPGLDDVRVVSIVDRPSSSDQPEVIANVPEAVRGDYVRAARLLGRLGIDVVLLQHEYGIFGGVDGDYVLSFVQELAQPLVVTLHTVLSRPSPGQQRVLSELCDQAELVVVMTGTARRLLIESGACASEKIRVVPHGAPDIVVGGAGRTGHSRLYLPPGKGRVDVSDRFVFSTFGLISSGKGLETAIEALATVVQRHPQALYVIAGRTHPAVAQREGERYRLELERRALDLGLADHVEFDDRFLKVEELSDLLAATDVFVTPYRDVEQIASGALTFAIAAGCAVISTPYWYAEDMLSTGAGRLVGFADSDELAEAMCAYIEDGSSLLEARREAQRIGAGLSWSAVAALTAEVLREAAVSAPRRTPMPAGLHLPAARTDHLRVLVDDVGIIQHAQGIIPGLAHGYCVDDVARLVLVAQGLARRDGDEAWTRVVIRSLAFLAAATDELGGGMRNFMSYDRSWLDEPHTGDHVGRSIAALGEFLATTSTPALVAPVRDMLTTLVGSLRGDISLRTAAQTVLGLARLDPDRLEFRASRLLAQCVEEIAAAHAIHASAGWSWFEDRLTYDNALLPHALIAGGIATGRADRVDTGLVTLRWLGDQCGLGAGELRLPGHFGRDRGEPGPGPGDEQPLEASALVEAELAAFAATSDPEHGVRAQIAFEWFLGRNRLRIPLYDFATGGCRDGLGEEEANQNEGAESTLAFHRAKLVLDAARLPNVVRHPLVAESRAGAGVLPPLRRGSLVPAASPRAKSSSHSSD
jgi:glycosyltransferase involved in cell wall biosynthesis